MMYIAEKVFFFKSSTFRLHFFLPCLCIREGGQKLSHKAWLKADLFCQGYSMFNLLAICWGAVLSQALSCASAAFQLLGSLAGKRVEMLGALCAATWKYCKSQLPFVKPSVLLNILVVVPCAYMLWLSTGLWEMRFICCSFSVRSASPLSHLCLSQLHHLAGLGRTETPNSSRSPVTCRQQMHYKTSSVLGCLILFLCLWCSRSPSYFCPLCIIVTTEMQHLWHPRMIFWVFFKTMSITGLLAEVHQLPASSLAAPLTVLDAL